MAPPRMGPAVVAALLLLFCVSNAAAGRRGLAQAVAKATSVAQAKDGGSANVQSRSQATSTGQPTSSEVTGVGIAGAGQTANVDCSLAAKDEKIAKICANLGQGQAEATTKGGGAGAAAGGQAGAQGAGAAAGAGAGAAAYSGVSWDAAPNCTADASKAETKVVYDSLGRPWGFEDNRSCAFRNAPLKPPTASAAGAGEAGVGGAGGAAGAGGGGQGAAKGEAAAGAGAKAGAEAGAKSGAAAGAQAGAQAGAEAGKQAAAQATATAQAQSGRK